MSITHDLVHVVCETREADPGCGDATDHGPGREPGGKTRHLADDVRRGAHAVNVTLGRALSAQRGKGNLGEIVTPVGTLL